MPKNTAVPSETREAAPDPVLEAGGPVAWPAEAIGAGGWTVYTAGAADIIDVRTLMPLDIETLRDSVCKTGRCLVAHEATRFCGYGAELVATIQKECFWHLEAPISRVTGWDTPYPHAFEWQ